MFTPGAEQLPVLAGEVEGSKVSPMTSQAKVTSSVARMEHQLGHHSGMSPETHHVSPGHSWDLGMVEPKLQGPGTPLRQGSWKLVD